MEIRKEVSEEKIFDLQIAYKIPRLFAGMKLPGKISFDHRTNAWLLLCVFLILVSTVTRVSLLIKSWPQVDATFFNLTGIFVFGFLYDAINAIYFSLPLMLYLWLARAGAFQRSGHRIILQVLFSIFIFVILFNAVAEWLFWDEFSSRFNFIAVDYLVYTTEVVGNINQSYPMAWIIIFLLAMSLVAFVSMRGFIAKPASDNTTFGTRSKFVSVYLVLFVLTLLLNSQLHSFSRNSMVNELAGNGLYELFAAYRNNELDYERFYKGMDTKQAFQVVNNMLHTSESSATSGSNHGIARSIDNIGSEKKLNVVLISVESFSAEFMKAFGNNEGITPFLDSLSQHSLLFTNLYATGTRTVRGLEALSLCVPPTPGQSIVRRPDNDHLFSMGKVFQDKGYSCEYIYGGYGYFDNMNAFFSGNNYNVVDRTSLEDQEVHYENIWGVADEDLFTLALKELDHKTKEQPVFAHIMTTSNHRPYTYPEGRIDIPSHTGRSGAVKYTDYAIGTFIKNAAKKKWFSNTIFVIVADHCASSAGKTKLPVNKYHIPMLIYSPANVQPATMDRLMSQIDIGPTLLGMLNFSYASKFFGYDMFKLEPGRERAFISTYQNLGYLKDGKLTILSPQQKAETFVLSDKMEPVGKVNDSSMVQEAVAWYQAASYSFKHNLMKQQ